MQLAIWAAFFELVTRVWGHTLVEVLHSSVNGRRIADALVGLIGTVFSTWLAWILLDTAILQALSPAAGRARLQPSTRARTILPLLRNGLKVTLVVAAGIGVLSNLGVNVTPLVAGAGVIGLAVGFGAQSLAQDLITGIFILMEDTISVGDTVDVGVATGTVISLTIRTVRLRDGVGAIHSIPFSQIKTVRNLSRDYSFADFEVRVAMDADPRQAIELVREAAAGTAGDARFERILIGVPEVFGLDRFEGGAMIVKGRFQDAPAEAGRCAARLQHGAQGWVRRGRRAAGDAGHGAAAVAGVRTVDGARRGRAAGRCRPSAGSAAGARRAGLMPQTWWPARPVTAAPPPGRWPAGCRARRSSSRRCAAWWSAPTAPGPRATGRSGSRPAYRPAESTAPSCPGPGAG